MIFTSVKKTLIVQLDIIIIIINEIYIAQVAANQRTLPITIPPGESNKSLPVAEKTCCTLYYIETLKLP